MDEENLAKCVIKENGEVEFDGEFSRNKLITLLRQELIYQKEKEKQGIIDEVKDHGGNS